MLVLFARFISTIFNPYFLILPIPYLLVIRETGNSDYAFKWTIFTLLFMGAVGGSVYALVRKGYFSDLDVSKREQRPLLFSLLALFSVLYLVGLFYFRGPLVLFVSLSGIFFSLIVFSFVNTRIKASIHVASITALLVIFSVLYGGIFLLFLFLIPLIGWSRLKINRHTRTEVYLGATMGILIPLVMFIFFKVLLGVSLSP